MTLHSTGDEPGPDVAPPPRSRAWSVAALLLLVAAPVQAQDLPNPDSLADLDLEQLGRIRITSVSRAPESVTGAMAAVFVITRDEIRRSGVTTLPEALRLAPGLQVTRTGSNNWTVTSRGLADFTTNKMLVQIDGRSIYSPLFAGVFWDTPFPPVQNIDRIEVILGPGATLWGSNAVNGIINVITRPAWETRGGSATASAGTAGELGGFGSYGSQLGRHTSFRVFGNFLRRDPFELSDGTSSRDEWQGGLGGFRLDAELTSRDRLMIRGDGYLGRTEAPTREALPQPPFERTVLAEGKLAGFNAVGRWTRRTGETGEFQVLAWLDHFYRRQFPDLGRIEVNMVALEFTHRFGLGDRQVVVWGGGYRIANSELPGTFTFRLDPVERTTHLVNLFVQDEIALIPDRLALTLGTKAEHNSYTGLEWQPSLRLRWATAPGQAFWASASRALRTPSRLDTDVRLIAGALPTDPPTYIRVDGNPDFQSEELITVEAGYRGDITPNLSFDLSAYYGWYDGLRSFAPGAPFVDNGQQISPLVAGNFGDARTSGGTLAVFWRALPGLRLRGSYTYLDARVEVKESAPAGAAVNVNPESSPEHQAAVTAAISLPAGFEGWLDTRYVSELGAFQVPAYLEADARLAWSRGPVSVALVGQDLLHRRHREFGPNRAIPRRARLDVTFRF